MSNASRSLNLSFSKNIFKGSFNSFIDVPNEHLPECCFVGRSNVGKSSIINAITKSKKLAKTSKTPGRTQNINSFLVSNKINIIDLPGYGYAKVSKTKREELYSLIENYLINRENLRRVFVLIDCKIGIKDSDIDILIELNGQIGSKFIDLAEELEKSLGRRVDLVSKKGVKDRYLKSIESELIYV